ncbi:UNKNOWN [Stylonychia lemnae]|uniref:Uncharacterized protein n=1 Tax=Stylonychia lemnae TaxID=5949 RepID=A0A078A335_STYLE|nr:UNKNOWN [Stylonychia lemnae]|eukprot:CDW75179.1 UNKNOWN [Stylonychia lemnae]
MIEEKYNTMTSYQRFSNLNDKFVPRKYNFSPEMKNQTHSFRSSQLSELTGTTLNQVRKSKKLVQGDVQKLHNRIRMLQLEEERALKKIEETRKKAKQMLEVKVANEKKRIKLNNSQTPVRNYRNLATASILNDEKEDPHQLHMLQLERSQKRKQEEISMIRKEKKLIQKRKQQIDKAYIRKNQERRNEIQQQIKEAHDRVESEKKRKLDEKLKMKEKLILSEAKNIKKREKEARQLELLEAEIVQRLKDTHLQQREAIQEIEKIFKGNNN